MDSYLEEKFKFGDHSIDNKKIKKIHSQLETISNNNIKKWFEMNSRNNKKYICDDIIEKLRDVFSSNLKKDEKKLIFFYTLYFQKKLESENFEITGNENIKISLKDSNWYTGRIDEKNFNIYFVYPSRRIERMFQVYKLYELYQITRPIIHLNYTCSSEKLLVIQDLQEISIFSDNFFIQILNILRQLNKNNYYAHITMNNLKRDGEKFFIVGLEELKSMKKPFKRQISRLEEVTGVKLPVKGDSYDKLILKLISKKMSH